jgi:hypothetical protein
MAEAHQMTLTALVEQPVIWPIADHPLITGADVVVEFYSYPMSPSNWAAYGIVLRGNPVRAAKDRHPNFSSSGVSEHEALHAMLTVMCNYFNAQQCELPRLH